MYILLLLLFVMWITFLLISSHLVQIQPSHTAFSSPLHFPSQIMALEPSQAPRPSLLTILISLKLSFLLVFTTVPNASLTSPHFIQTFFHTDMYNLSCVVWTLWCKRVETFYFIRDGSKFCCHVQLSACSSWSSRLQQMCSLERRLTTMSCMSSDRT